MKTVKLEELTDIQDILRIANENNEPVYVVDGDKAVLMFLRAGAVTLDKLTFSPDEIDDISFVELIMRDAFRVGQKFITVNDIERQYNIDYLRAARLMNIMSDHGFVSKPPKGIPHRITIGESELAEQLEKLSFTEITQSDEGNDKRPTEIPPGFFAENKAQREFFACNSATIKAVMEDALSGDGRITVSRTQRRFAIGYAYAARIIDFLCDCGFIIWLDSGKPYFVNVTEEQFTEAFAWLEKEIFG